MAKLRWLGWVGAMALASTPACGSSSNAPDGGAGGQDGSLPNDAASSPDASSDAEASDAGSTDAGCVTATVTFELRAAPAAPAYCVGAQGSCAGDWLDIRSADGTTSFDREMGCVTQCNDCQPIECPLICLEPSLLGDAGAHTTWDGTYYPKSTCGSMGTTCLRTACAPAGNYVAKFCGHPGTGDASVLGACSASGTPTCVEAPFTWPPAAGSAPVLGVLGGP
jgi:hypothetical protein